MFFFSGWTQPACVAGLDLASPASSLAHASDQPQPLMHV